MTSIMESQKYLNWSGYDDHDKIFSIPSCSKGRINRQLRKEIQKIPDNYLRNIRDHWKISGDFSVTDLIYGKQDKNESVTFHCFIVGAKLWILIFCRLIPAF